jgi:hypothetical protein
MSVAWVQAATAPNEAIAELWREELEREGIPALVAPSNVGSYLGVSIFPTDVLVESPRLAEARALLEPHGPDPDLG